MVVGLVMFFFCFLFLLFTQLQPKEQWFWGRRSKKIVKLFILRAIIVAFHSISYIKYSVFCLDIAGWCHFPSQHGNNKASEMISRWANKFKRRKKIKLNKREIIDSILEQLKCFFFSSSNYFNTLDDWVVRSNEMNTFYLRFFWFLLKWFITVSLVCLFDVLLVASKLIYIFSFKRNIDVQSIEIISTDRIRN